MAVRVADAHIDEELKAARCGTGSSLSVVDPSLE